MEYPAASHSTDSEQLHPLKNPLILSHLFSICPPSLLKNCRLVCHQWLTISLPIWRSSFPLKFRNDRDMGYVMQSGNARKVLSLQEFLEYVQNPTHEYRSQPHRHFSLWHWNFGRSEEEDPLFQQFWHEVAPSVVKLFLIICTFPDAAAFRKIVFQRFPALRQLTLTDCTIGANMSELIKGVEEPVYEEHRHLQFLSIFRTSPKTFPVPFLEFLGHFPWITSLKYMGPVDEQEDNRDLNDLLKIIKTIREGDNRKFPLQHFSSNGTLPEICEAVESHQTMALFRELRIPLHSLRIRLTTGMDDNAAKAAFEDHQDTIRKLFIFQAIDMGNEPKFKSWAVPVTVKLSKLRQLSVNQTPLENMDFLEFTPNLEELSMSDIRSRLNQCDILETMMVSGSCKQKMAGVRLLQLRHFSLEYFVTDQDLQELVRLMPNVRNLAMILNANQFEVVCGHLKHVEDLRLKWGSAVLTDRMVCGRKFESEGNDIPRRPNITNLQYLKTIQFGENNLTDISVFEGFALLPKLEQVVASVEFGQEAQNALADKNVRPFRM